MAAEHSLRVGIVLFFVGLIAARHPSVEGLAVMVAVILATGVAFLSEYKSDREFEVLNAHKDSLSVKVLRDGGVHTIPMEEVWSAMPWCWRLATRSLPTAGSSRRPICTSINR